VLVFVTLLAATVAARAATITIVNGDGAGKGFNDPTPVSPVGGNSGTTLGAQRLIAVQKAAQIWGATVQSGIEIKVDARFDPNPPTGLPCDANSATLGSAGAISGVIFSGGPFPNTFYPIALANAINGTDNHPDMDIRAWFNGKIDNNNNCLAGTNWYYGLDHNEGNNIDVLATAFHEIAHGLGFQNYVNLANGAFHPTVPDIYSRFIIDSSIGKRWDQMSNAERFTSSKNCGNVVWGGANVSSNVAGFLNLGTPRLKINSPAGIADVYKVGEAASSGAPLGSPGVTAPVQLVNDGSGTITDGCQSLLAFVPGNIALMDRNSAACTTVTQITNAQNAGASAALIVDSSAGCPPPAISGTGTTIPAAQISVATGNLITGQLPSPGVNATLGLDNARRQGADPFGFAELSITDPVQAGSSISHFDTSANPSLLMEPAITPALTSSLDLTPYLLADIGWNLSNPANLSITKTDNADPVIAGSPLAYTITVTNHGPGDANDVIVTDTLPAGVTFASTSGCNNDPSGLPGCNLGTVFSGTSKQFTLNVNVNGGVPGPLTNSVAVTSSTRDTNLANNQASEGTNVLVAPPACPGDLTLTQQTLSGTQTLQATSTATLGPNLIVDGTDIAINAPTVEIFGAIEINGAFSIGTTPACP
jgi:uncharacterized repeat protein (TIGR01451 family)